MVVEKQSPKETFSKNWTIWQHGLIDYAKHCKRTIGLKHALRDLEKDTGKQNFYIY